MGKLSHAQGPHDTSGVAGPTMTFGQGHPGGSMRKSDIANEIFEKVGVSKKEASDIVELILNLLKSVLQKGESVKIAGFGNFVVRSKGARKGRNPRTGQEIGITPRRVVTFRPSQVFKKYVNS